MMTVPLRKSTASGSSKATLTSSLNELRDIVRALEGKPPAVLTEGFEQSPNVDEPTDPLAQKNARADQRRLSFGIDSVDRILCGGLMSDALHEIFPKKAEWDDGLTTAFALAMLSRLQASDLGYAVSSVTGERTLRPVVWITQRDTAGATLSPQGLMALGFNPDGLFQIETQSDADALWAYGEVLNHSELGSAVVEVCNLDLAQSHRIQLRAQETQVSGRYRLLMMLRRNKGARQPQVQPTSAATRWRLGPVAPQKLAPTDRDNVGSARVPNSTLSPQGHYFLSQRSAREHSTSNLASQATQSCVTPLVPHMIGSPLSQVRWAAELFRQRGGPSADWFLEWSYEHGQFHQLTKLK